MKAQPRPGALLYGTIGLVLAGVAPAQASVQRSAIASKALVLDGVTVVDVERGKLVSAQRIVIVGNRIRSVGSGDVIKVPKGAQVVDARGKYLIPGLWDMHTHSLHDIERFYPLFVANGVTGIRDAGSDVSLDTLLGYRREILAGTRVGPPRQVLSGAAVHEGPPCARTGLAEPICIPQGDSAAARRLVDSLRTAGADMIKTYALSRETYFVVLAEARRLGIPVGGHISPTIFASFGGGGVLATAIQASDSGVSIIDHAHSSGGLNTLCLGPAARVDRCRPVAERFRRNGTWWVPTLIREVLCNEPGSKPDVESASDSVCMRSSELATQFWSGSLPKAGWLHGAVGVNDADSVRFLSVAQRAGLPILAGTDVGPWVTAWQVPGFTLHAELAMYVAEGLTTLEALQSATLNPAKMLHATDSLGSVAPGKLADLVLLDGNPLQDITNTTTIRAVVANGRYFDRAGLDGLFAKVQAEPGAAVDPEP